MQTSMLCRKCGTHNSPGVVSCKDCGSSLCPWHLTSVADFAFGLAILGMGCALLMGPSLVIETRDYSGKVFFSIILVVVFLLSALLLGASLAILRGRNWGRWVTAILMSLGILVFLAMNMLDKPKLDRLSLSLAAIMGSWVLYLFTPSVRAFCSAPRSQAIMCPACGKRLGGVMPDMIGDVGVCSACKTEFTIQQPQASREHTVGTK